MNLKRRPIREKYAAEIDELYAAEVGASVHEPKAASGGGSLNTSRHVSVWIDGGQRRSTSWRRTRTTCPSGRQGWPVGGLRQTAGGWVADSPMGEVTVEFAPPNEFGVLE